MPWQKVYWHFMQNYPAYPGNDKVHNDLPGSPDFYRQPLMPPKIRLRRKRTRKM
jgi:hypothetical protein